MKIRIQIILAALAFIAISNSTRAANIVWTNTAGGNWSDTNSWSPNQSPGAGDIAIITNNGSYTVTVDVDSAAGGIVVGAAGNSGTQIFLVAGHALTLNGQAVVNTNGQFNFTGNTISGNAVLSGALNCSGGNFSGALTVAAGGVLNIGAAGMSLNSQFGGSVLLTNYGTVNWSSGTVSCNYGPQIYNYGLWNAQTNNLFLGQQAFGSGTAVFNNFGTFRKSAGAGTTTIDSSTIFNSSGTVDVESGTVSVSGGAGSGTLNIAGGASFSSGSGYLFTGSTFFSGTGTLTGYLVGNNGVLSGALTCVGPTLSGKLTVATNTTLNLGTAAVSFNGNIAGTCILTNYGTVIWNSGLNGDDGPQIYNYGLWDDQTNSALSGQQSTGVTTFNNFGTFRKSGGAGTTAFDASTVFNSSGTVDVESGTVSISTGTGSGAVNIAGGASLAPDTGYLFNGSTFFSGTGNFAGYLIGANAVLSGSLHCAGTTLSGTLTVATNGTLNLGATTVTLDSFYAGSIYLTNYGTVVWGAGTINGNNFDGNSNHNPYVYNYGLWDAQADNTFAGDEHYGFTTFNNFGTLRKSVGTGTTTLDPSTVFNSSGTVDVESGTVLISTGTGSGTVNIAGSASFSPGSGYSFSGATFFSGTGNLAGYLIGTNAILTGTLNCSGTTLAGTLTLATNGTLNVISPGLVINSFFAGGTGILTNNGTVAWSGGTIAGNNSPQIFNKGLWSILSDNAFNGQQSENSGSTTFNNLGTFRKTAATGTTTVGDFLNFINTGTVDVQSGTVNFTLNPSLAGGILNFGINSSNSFGKISISGSPTLAGTVSANLNNLFAPGTNNSFAVLTYASQTGAFTNYSLPILPGLIWQTNYGSTAFTLSVASIPPSSFSPAATTAGGGAFSFSFGTVPGHTYQIQSTTNLAPANWITNLTFQATNSSITFSNIINANPQLFFRTVLQQ